MGDGNRQQAVRSTPVDVKGLDGRITMIAAGEGHTFALSQAGALQCWGHNDRGQLGNRSFVDSENPVYVTSF
jgi:alpha-tubulin suppressor-like RCC1 family protein